MSQLLIMKHFFTLLIKIVMNTTTNAPQWLDRSLYPFESKFIRLEAGRMHYIDEGSGDILLFVHGTPTWSFLYRDFIKELSADYRCIAVDHLGFGLSEKPGAFSGTPQDHAKNLSEFIVKKDLRDITLVVHDFGGPIGLATGIENADRIKKVVLFNSWLWATKDDEDVQKIDRLINGWLGRFLYLNFNFSPRVLLKQGFSDKKNLPRVVHLHYTQPFPSKDSRIPLLNIAKALVGSSDWYQEQWETLDRLADKEWLILWGTADQFITTAYLDRWKKRLPRAKIREFDCGHFVQEERAGESIGEIRSFMGEHERPSAIWK